ncbi:MAG: hypothetical protein HQK50_07640 [Oligoflexia bacterium]|nr:hypothetical protein [Oligoflexia bacterium]MBF0365428.1 hypothetical protein [Oligoflexia bacterium]
MKLHKLIFTVSLLSLLSSCGDDSAPAAAASSSSSTTSGTVLSSAVQNTAPYITATSDQLATDEESSAYDADAVPKADTWATGSGNYEAFNLLRQYTYPADEGRLDMSNMYKALYTIKTKLDDADSECASNQITEKSIASPFTGFSTSYNYTCALTEGTLSDTYVKSIAMKYTAGIYNILYGWQWAGNASGGSMGVAQAQYDSVSNALVYEMVNCVNCGGGTSSSFTVRTYISGNPATHAFTIKTISRSSTGFKAMVGKGTAQSSSDYMLLKYTTDGTTFSYYCFQGSATETDFRAATGSATVPSNCSSLATDVDALTFFSSSNAPFALSDFTNSTILLSY